MKRIVVVVVIIIIIMAKDNVFALYLLYTHTFLSDVQRAKRCGCKDVSDVEEASNSGRSWNVHCRVRS